MSIDNRSLRKELYDYAKSLGKNPIWRTSSVSSLKDSIASVARGYPQALQQTIRIDNRTVKGAERSRLWRDAKSLGYNRPYSSSKISELRNYISRPNRVIRTIQETQSINVSANMNRIRYLGGHPYGSAMYKQHANEIKEINKAHYDFKRRTADKYRTDSGTYGVKVKIPVRGTDKDIKIAVKRAIKRFPKSTHIIVMINHGGGPDDNKTLRGNSRDKIMRDLNIMLEENSHKYDNGSRSLHSSQSYVLVTSVNHSPPIVYEGEYEDEDVSIRGRGAIKHPSIRSYQQATNTWKVMNIDTDINCAYVAAQVCIDKKFDGHTIDKAKHLKSRIGPDETKYSDLHTLQQIANHIKRGIILYGQVFQKLHHILPDTRVSKSTIKRGKERDDIEIQYRDNHFIALLRWKNINEKPAEIVEVKQTHLNQLAEPKMIKKVYNSNKKEFKVLTWDIETSTKSITDNQFQTYACGVYDGETYVDFWGIDALQQFSKWLYDNAKKYNGYHLYAHNGGKFDVVQLMHEVLLKSELWSLVCKDGKNIELNGRWLSITLAPQLISGVTLSFKDSVCLLTSSLDSLTREFKVPHQKLTETVNHDDITLDNYHTFPQLKDYLKNDVLGLYEVLEIFHNIVWDISLTTFNNDETLACNVFKKMINKPIECNVRLPCMKSKGGKYPLEFDGYCEELNLAFEYNGRQHYEPVPYFNKKTPFEIIKRNDELKNILAKQNGIHLITLPYTVNERDMVNYISHKLTLLHIPHNNKVTITDEMKVCKTVGINITECLTAATLSKKLYFLKYYNERKHPIFMLPSETDHYIRDGFRGGRVEIWNLGVVPNTITKQIQDTKSEDTSIQPQDTKGKHKFYYYDFTSLYPDVMRNDLPYGCPVYKENVEIDDIVSGKFFGICKVLVKTLPSGYNIKPLHAFHKDHKLLFPYFDKPQELTLFSEEIKLGYTQGIYEYKIIDGYQFKPGKFMADFENEFFKLKRESDIDGNNAKKLIWKIILNSSFGFWGLRTENRDGIKIYPRGGAPIQKFIDQRKLIGESDIGNYTILRVLNDLDVRDFNVAVAAAITSHARMKLWGLLNDIDKVGHKVFMCDTDSVICSMNIDDYPELKQKYMWDGEGVDLGSLKNELNGEVKRSPQEVGNLGFDECILGGAKFYSLKANNVEMVNINKETKVKEKYFKNIEICKCKGYSQKKDKGGEKLSHKNFEEHNIEQNQLQFSSGKSSYINEANPFAIFKNTVHKKINFSYTKGIVHDDGHITPLLF